VDRIKGLDSSSSDSLTLNYATAVIDELKEQLNLLESTESLFDAQALCLPRSALEDIEKELRRIKGFVDDSQMAVESNQMETNLAMADCDTVHIDPMWIEQLITKASSSSEPQLDKTAYGGSGSFANIFSSMGTGLHQRQMAAILQPNCYSASESVLSQVQDLPQAVWNDISAMFRGHPSHLWTWPSLIVSLAEISSQTQRIICPSEVSAYILNQLTMRHKLDLLILVRLIATLLDRCPSGTRSRLQSISSSLGSLLISSIKTHLTQASWKDELLLDQIFETILLLHNSTPECMGSCSAPSAALSVPYSRVTDLMGWLISHALNCQIPLSLLVNASLNAESSHRGFKYFSWYWAELLVALMVNWAQILPTKELSASIDCIRLLPSHQDANVNQQDAQTHFGEAWGDLSETFVGSIVLGVEREMLITAIQRAVSSFFCSRSYFEKHFPEQTYSLKSSLMISHVIQLADLRDRFGHPLDDSPPSKLPFWQRIFGRVMDGISSPDVVDLARLLHYHRLNSTPRFWLRGQWISWIMSALQHIRHSKNIISVIQHRLPFEPRKFVEEIAQMAHAKIESDEPSYAPFTAHQSIAKGLASLKSVHSELKKLLKVFTRAHIALVLPKWTKARPLRVGPKEPNSATDDGLDAGLRLLAKLVGVVETSHGTSAFYKPLPIQVILQELDGTHCTGENARILDNLALALTIYTPIELWWRSRQPEATIPAENPDPNDVAFVAFFKSVAFVASSLAQFLPHYRPAIIAACSPLPPSIRHHFVRLSSYERPDNSLLSNIPLLEDEESVEQMTETVSSVILRWVISEPLYCLPDLYDLWTTISQSICKSAGKGHLLVLLGVCNRLRGWVVPGLLETVLSDRLVQLSAQSASAAHDFRLIFAILQLMGEDFPFYPSLLLNQAFLRSFYIPTYSGHAHNYAAPGQLLLHRLLEDTQLRQQVYELPLLRERLLWLICRQQEPDLMRHVYLGWIAIIQPLELDFQRRYAKLRKAANTSLTTSEPILPLTSSSEWSKLLKGVAAWDSELLEESIIAQTRHQISELDGGLSAHECDQALHPGVSLLESQPGALYGAISWKTNVPFPVLLEWEMEASLAHRTAHVDGTAYTNHLIATVMCQIAVFPFERTSQLLTRMLNASWPFPDEPRPFQPRTLPIAWNAVWRQACTLCLRLNPFWLMELLLRLPAEITFTHKLRPDPLTGATQKDQESSQLTISTFVQNHFASGIIHLFRELNSHNQFIPTLPSESTYQEMLFSRLRSLLGHNLIRSFDSWMGWIWGEVIAHIEAIQPTPATRDFFLASLFSFVSSDPHLLHSFTKHWFQAYLPHFARTNPWLVGVLSEFFNRFPSDIEPTHAFESALSEVCNKRHDVLNATFFSSPVLSEMEALQSRRAILSARLPSNTGTDRAYNTAEQPKSSTVVGEPIGHSMMASASIASLADLSSPAVQVRALRAPTERGHSDFLPPKDIYVPNLPKEGGAAAVSSKLTLPNGSADIQPMRSSIIMPQPQKGTHTGKVKPKTVGEMAAESSFAELSFSPSYLATQVQQSANPRSRMRESRPEESDSDYDAFSPATKKSKLQ
jgi:hypothetical protein